MSVVAINTVRVGIEVTRNDSEWSQADYRMFWCRQKDKAPDQYVWSWAQECVSCLPYHGHLPGVLALPIGTTARYWVTMVLTGTRDYWGEYDDEVEILKCRRIK